MVALKIKRFDLEKDWTLGKLYENNTLTGYTVEDEVRNIKLKGETAIPLGRYKLASRYSPKFSYQYYWNGETNKLIFYKDFNLLSKDEKRAFVPHSLIWILNIPNFQYVLIHWGNTDLDTEGCIIIGDKIGTIKGRSGVINSRRFYIDFYQRVYPELDNNSFITLENFK